jgi:hypothetical protein
MQMMTWGGAQQSFFSDKIMAHKVAQGMTSYFDTLPRA